MHSSLNLVELFSSIHFLSDPSLHFVATASSFFTQLPFSLCATSPQPSASQLIFSYPIFEFQLLWATYSTCSPRASSLSFLDSKPLPRAVEHALRSWSIVLSCPLLHVTIAAQAHRACFVQPRNPFGIPRTQSHAPTCPSPDHCAGALGFTYPILSITRKLLIYNSLGNLHKRILLNLLHLKGN